MDFLYEMEKIKTRIAELHSIGIKFVIYKPLSGLSEHSNFMEYKVSDRTLRNCIKDLADRRPVKIEIKKIP